MKEHIIKSVEAGSIAEELEIEAGDVLLSINDEEIEDIFDYRFLIKDEYLEIVIRKADGEEWLLEIEKEYDDDLGVEFENALMSEYRSCSNRCIFCFIDQMPPGMRETLYFKDDDSRLSFLQGNYITLSNMKEKDVDRIIRMNLAPINISVQTTNPELRCKMLNNRFAGDKLKFLDRFYEGHIEMNGQVVCCKNVNDGDELKRTIEDLSKYLPFMKSVSVVPAGITKYREGLYPLELFSKEDREALKHLINSKKYPKLKKNLHRTITMATGKLTYPTLQVFVEQVKQYFPGLTIHIVCIRNDFFGATITVSGLITGQDLVGQIKERQKEGLELGNVLNIPSTMLRMGKQVFLDDMTVDEVERELGMKVVPVESGGKDFLEAMTNMQYRMERDNGNFVYIQAYDR